MVKIGIEAMLTIEKFLITKNWSIRPNSSQKHSLTPTRMSADQIWIKALVTQSRSCASDSLSTNHLRFGFPHQRMNTCTISLTKGITKISNIIWDSIRRLYLIKPQTNHLMSSHARQTAKDMDVLPWKVLMNEENPHEFRDAAAIPPCPGILPAAAAGRTPCAA